MRALLLIALLALPACTPAVIGAAASATQAAAAVYSKGRISAAAIAGYGDVQTAVRKAAADLSLDLTYVREDAIWSRYTMRDDRNKAFTIYVRVRTETMTQVDIDVGRFGNEAIGRLLLLRLGAHLPESGLDDLFGDLGDDPITTTG